MTGASDPTPVTPDPEPALRLVTLGRAALLTADNTLVLGPGKPLALLSYLRSIQGRIATREHLIDLLWADSDPARGRAALRQTLLRLRQTVAPDLFSGDREDVALSRTVWHDREEFLSAIDRNEPARAIELYGGQFFPDFGGTGSVRFEHWVDSERSYLRGAFLRAGETVARRALESAPRDALVLARRLHQEDPHSEALHRLLLQCAMADRDLMLATTEADALERSLAEHGQQLEPASIALIRLVRQEASVLAVEDEQAGLVAELVGREKEFAGLLAAWHEAARRQARIVHLEARAGFGKSRLLHDFGVRLRANGTTVVTVKGHQGEQDLAGSLASDLVRALADLPGAAGIAPGYVPALIALHPPLAARFPHAAAHTPGVDLTHQRGVALAELLGAIADEQPIALLIDDLHWADSASRQMLVGAANRLGNARVLLVTAARPGAAGPLIPESSVWRLEPLTMTDCEALVASVASPPDAEWSRRIADTLWRVSHGSPLLATAALQLALERGGVVATDGSWQPGDLDLSVRQLGECDPLQDRLRSLGLSERRALLTLAVAGAPLARRQFEPGSPDESARRPSLAELEVGGFVARVGDAWTVGHDELGQALLVQVAPAELEACHRELGRRLVGEGAPPGQLQRGVRHLVLGGVEGDLAGVTRTWVAARRRQGDTRPAGVIIGELLGVELGTMERIKRLRTGLPFPLRFGIGIRGVVGAAAVLLVLAVGVAALRANRPVPPPPEATLLYAVTEAGSEFLTLMAVGIREDRWHPGDSLTSGQGDPVGRWRESATSSSTPAPRPGGGALVTTRIMDDSGQVDLFLGRYDGTSERLTATPGDDIDPAWSPDGRQLVFATARWTPRGDDDLDVAIMDLATDAVRQISSGADYDHTPMWSPDGTRIAFVRRPAVGAWKMCLATLEGAVRCHAVVATPFGMVGWRGAESIVVTTEAGEWLIISADRGTVTPLMADLRTAAAVMSQDGRWVAADTRGGANGLPRLVAFPLARPDHQIALALTPGLELKRIAWAIPGTDRAIARLAVVPSGPPALLGVTHRLRVEAFDSAGNSTNLPAGVLRWWLDGTSRASIGADNGVLTPREVGSVVVHVTAGGWREASAVITIEPNVVTPGPSETWSDDSLTGWQRLGRPRPAVVALPRGGRALAINGDGSFDSSVLAAAPMPSRRGVGAEFEVSTPIDRDKWQRIRVALLGEYSIGPSGLPVGTAACGFSTPTGEGAINLKRMGLGGQTGGATFDVPGWIRSGGWYRVRLQVFPDGTCGVALNGRAIWRSAQAMGLDPGLRVLMHGQTVGTMIVVRSVGTWQGVKTDLDWGLALESPPLGHGPQDHLGDRP